MAALSIVCCAWSVVSDNGLLTTEHRLSCRIAPPRIPEGSSHMTGDTMIDPFRIRLPVRLLVGLWLLSLGVGSAIAAEKPNIVILLCDDLGYGDLSCFAHPKMRTPHLDKLAAEGVKLTHCYSSAPVCSPSRAGLLTGRIPNRLGIRDWIPANSGIYLRPAEVTVAQLLKDAGKWHLNSKNP